MIEEIGYDDLTDNELDDLVRQRLESALARHTRETLSADEIMTRAVLDVEEEFDGFLNIRSKRLDE